MYGGFRVLILGFSGRLDSVKQDATTTESPPPAAVFASNINSREDGIDIMFGLSRRAEKPARFPSGSCQKLSLPEPKVGPSNSKIPSNSDHRYAGPTSGFDHFTRRFRHVGIAYRSIALPYQLDMQRRHLFRMQAMH